MWLTCLFFLLLVWTSWGYGEHHQALGWMSGTKAADGSSCCGISDCTRAHAKLLEEPTGDKVRVYVEAVTRSYFSTDYQPVNREITLPVGSVHRSIETFDLWCYRNYGYGDTPLVRADTTRCLFIAVGN
jgi:hypothetical protein